MFKKITPLQWEYLNKPKGICILRFNDEKTYNRALWWVDTIWRIPWELLYKDVKKEGVALWTIVVPDDTFKMFFHPLRGMVGKFEAEWLGI